MKFRPLTTALAASLSVGITHSILAQSLADRVHSAPAGRVQFSFATRPDVCGDGRNYLSIDESSYYGRVTVNNSVPNVPCTAGPARVVIDRDGATIISVETVAGPLHPADGVTDLGTVSPSDASKYLLGIAATTDGRAGRDAIMPAAIAQGVDVHDALSSLARNRNLPLDARRGAIQWLGREDDSHSASTTSIITAIARDNDESQQLRQTALGLLARLPHGAGIGSLEGIARDGSNSWAGEQAYRALAQSGDPRTRTFLREQLQRTDLADNTLAVIVRGTGSEYATAEDIDALRNAFPKMTGDRTRNAVIEVVARRGTATDVTWLQGVARNTSERPNARRAALDYLSRTTSDNGTMISMYDGVADASLKQSLINMYARNADKASVEKLISIAKNDSNPELRRSAMRSLARTQDPRAVAALQEISAK